ncbi:MAG: creatininase family protein [Pseudomonadota bacterium]
MTRQLELLRPGQIDAEMARCPRVWLPLGTIEYHSHHLPVGLDGLQAHGLCLDAAEIAGGLVYPPLWWGTGGGHAGYPWTVMMPGEGEICALLRQTLRRLQTCGVRQAILFTGHFADEQVAMIAGLASGWNAQGGPLGVLALSVSGNADAPLPPDHAGRFETTLLAAYQPQTVDMALLRPAHPDEADEDPFGPQRHAPGHSLHGIFGADPRGYRPEDAATLRRSMAEWLAAQAGLPPA